MIKLNITINVNPDSCDIEYLKSVLRKQAETPVEVNIWDENYSYGPGFITAASGVLVKVGVARGPGFIYFASDGSAFKIGRSKDPEKRILSIQTGCSAKVVLFKSLPVGDMKSAEQYFHRLFASRRQHGEWFSIGEHEIEPAILAYRSEYGDE